MLYFAIASFIIAFAITAAVGPTVIRKLRELKLGQKILEIGPKWHLKKGNVPTMGGIMFIFALVVTVLLILLFVPVFAEKLGADAAYILSPDQRWITALTVMGLALANGLVGFLDDYEKIKKKQNLGLTAKQKFLLQCAVSLVFILILRGAGYLTPHIRIPFTDTVWTWPWWVYIPFMMFVIVGTVNSVNLTDGIDGLAASVTMLVSLFFTAAALCMLSLGECETGAALGASVFGSALAGSLAGFLLFNANPAKVFMGDTGSLFLGAAVCGLAFAIDMPLLLIPVGIVYIIETLSDILQIGYFKLTKKRTGTGKRIFKMAPIHHHFEMCGWSERKIDLVACLITLLMCALCLWGILL